VDVTLVTLANLGGGRALAPGNLLLAHPMIGDHMFRRSVILVVSHDKEGTYGLILNRGTDYRVETAVKGGMPDNFFEAFALNSVRCGGPVRWPPSHCQSTLW
jgi:putative transcriptional regulator